MTTAITTEIYQDCSTRRSLMTVLTRQPQSRAEITAKLRERGHDKTGAAVWHDLKKLVEEKAVEVGKFHSTKGRKPLNTYRLADDFKPVLAEIYQFPRCTSPMDWCAKHLAVA